MTIITVTTRRGRLSADQRRQLARTLTDAVLVPEVGQAALPARIGFQVHFTELDVDAMAIGGAVLADLPGEPDPMTIDVTVMDAAWPNDLRKQVIGNILDAMAQACGLSAPPPSWWVTFRVVEEGSWGSRGGVLSILDLLDSGVFTAERAGAIRAEMEGRASR